MKLKLITEEREKKIFFLNNPELGLLIPPNEVWSTQKYLERNTILNVLCNQYYDSEDYIHDCEDFKSMC